MKKQKILFNYLFKLYDLYTSINLKKMTGVAMLTASMMMITADANAQTFATVQTLPFNLTDIGYRSAPTFVDLDGDGDLDLMAGENNGDFKYFENTGTTSAPSFATVQSNPFNLTDIGSYSAPTFADLDGDGDLDLMAGQQNGNFKYFKNTGTTSAPSFATVQSNPFNLTDIGSYSAPTFADLDGDGDLDLMAGEYNGKFRYLENTGTTSAPSFATFQSNPFNLTDIGSASAPTFADLDGDGDLDLMAGEYYGGFNYFENTGTTSAPSFATAQFNPFNLTDIGDNSTPTFADLDGDGDLDLMVGASNGNFYYFENTTITPPPPPKNWTGIISTDWATANNWSDSIVPTAANVVIIPSTGITNFPVIAAATSVGKVTVASGASLTVNTGIVLSDTITNNGILKLKNGAYLDDFTNASAAVVGNITVETLAANGVSNDQRLISSAVSNPAFSEIADDLNGPSGAGAQGANGVAITVDDCATPTLTSASNYGNLFEFDESLVTTCSLDGWVVRSSGNLENGRGYSAYLTNNSIFEFTGTPNSGDVTIAVSKGTSGVTDGEGWNLIGNPYPSAISRDDVVTAGASDVQYFVTTGVYEGTYSAYTPTSNIAIGQGFQVQVAASGNITFTDAMRNTNAATWYQNDNWFEHKLEVSVQGPSFADKTTLFYNNEATANYEAMYDVTKRKSNAGHPSLSTFGAGKDLTLNGQSVDELGNTIPMNLDAGANGSFTLSFEGKETFPANTTIYVKDLQENVMHNIANGDYTFTANTADNAERFEIVFIPEVDFTATKVDCDLNDASIVLNNTDFTANRSFELVQNNTVLSSGALADLNTVSLQAGNYSLEVADAFGGVQSYDLTIENAETIEASLEISSNEVFVGEIISLNNTTANANTVVWFIDNENISSVNNLSYSFEAAGVYNVVMSVSNDDCADTKTETVTVANKTTAIETLEGQEINFYPNPASSFLHIESDIDIIVEFIDALGKSVLKTADKKINIESLNTGVYFLKIYNGNNQLIGTQKVIKK